MAGRCLVTGVFVQTLLRAYLLEMAQRILLRVGQMADVAIERVGRFVLRRVTLLRLASPGLQQIAHFGLSLATSLSSNEADNFAGIGRKRAATDA